MALTYNYSTNDRSSGGSQIRVNSTVTCDNSYPTGGYSFNPAMIQLSFAKKLDLEKNSALPHLEYQYDYTNKKILIYDTSSQTAGVGGSVVETESPGGGDIKGSANTDSENADAAALPTNGAYVSAVVAVAAGAWTVGAITNPDVQRNVCIVVQNDSGGALNLFEGVTTFTVTGTKNGAIVIDTITFTSNAGNKSVADTKFRYKYGTQPFDTITGVTIANVPADGLKIGVGLGSKIGILKPLYTPAAADVVKLTKNGADLSPTGIVDFANATRGVNFGTLANGDDISISYKTKAYTGLTEVPNGTDLSAVTIRYEAIGF